MTRHFKQLIATIVLFILASICGLNPAFAAAKTYCYSDPTDCPYGNHIGCRTTAIWTTNDGTYFYCQDQTSNLEEGQTDDLPGVSSGLACPYPAGSCNAFAICHNVWPPPGCTNDQ